MDITTEMAGISLKNPYLLASAPPTGSFEKIRAADNSGWAGAVTKTISASPRYSQNLTPSIQPARAQHWRQLGILNNELVTAGSLDTWCDYEIPRAKAEMSADFCLGVSIMEGPSPREWERTASLVSQAGASYVELNVSCPHGQPEKFRGSFIGDAPELLGEVVRAARNGSAVPIVVKLNATSPCMMLSAEAALESGADGIVTTNTIAALPSVAPRNGSNGGLGTPVTTMGLSGPAILPINRLATARLATAFPGKVVAVGGVTSALDALDYLLLGASAVQVGTAVMEKGVSLIMRLLEELSTRLSWPGGGNPLRSCIGQALPRLALAEEALLLDAPSIAVVDLGACISCPQCVKACDFGGAGCIVRTGDGIAIDSSTCTGCGLCLPICPTGALTLRPGRLSPPKTQ